MLVPMVKVQIIGHHHCLDEALDRLYQLQMVQIIDAGQDPTLALKSMTLGAERLQELETLRYLRTRLQALLQLLPPKLAATVNQISADGVFSAEMLSALRDQLDDLTQQVQELVQQLDLLREEQASLPRYGRSIQRLLPLIPELTQLQGYETIALLLSSRHARVLDLLRDELTDLVGSHFEIMSALVDPDTIGAVLVFPRTHSSQVRALLGREQVSEVRLPPQLSGVPLSRALASIEQRLQEIPDEIAAREQNLTTLVSRHRDRWHAASRYINSRLDQLEAIRQLGATSYTFVVVGWAPEPELPRLERMLAELSHPELALYKLPVSAEEQARAPVLISNPAPARPFEFLVRLLSLPRYGTIDPTVLMSIFLPLFFGMTLGDVAYGLILMAVALVLHRRLGGTSETWRDLSRILLMSAAWAVVFGFVYGEFLGNLGHQLGMQPLWINREESLAPLLILSIVVGMAHVTLGLGLGVWNAWRQRHGHELMEKVGMLVALAGLFLLTATAVGRFPRGFFTPAIAALVVGMAILIRVQGVLGLLTAPLEVLSTVGNMLSYLRIAAIGLSSVYLARVANELAGATGVIWLGIIIAVLFHTLNVALGAFSPTIHSLRLHYVEFFGKFYQEGGVPFVPFGQSQDKPLLEGTGGAAA